jgi:hypothetical protein
LKYSTARSQTQLEGAGVDNSAFNEKDSVIVKRIGKISLLIAFLMAAPAFAQQTPVQTPVVLTPGNLVVAVEGCGVQGGTCTSVPNGTGPSAGYGDNQAAPITLFQYTPTGTSSVKFVNSLVLPQGGSFANLPFSGEYGSSSEGTMHLSGQGQYLALMGYGIGAPLFNANPPFYGSNDPTKPGALAQSTSLTTYANPVARVVALIDSYGHVNTSTALFNVFDVNNPRSVFTADGLNAYVSGQGSGCDATGGVFYTPLFATNVAPIAITGLDAGTNPPNCTQTDAQDTRDLQILTNALASPNTTTLFVSVDSKEGHSDNRDFIGTLGTPPATSLFTPPLPQTSGYTTGPSQIPGLGNNGGTGKVTITACGTNNTSTNGNPINCVTSTTRAINMSPENYFFASPSVLYVADSGSPKNDSNGDDSTSSTNIGDGGLQKWVNSKSDGTGTWSLAYTLWNGLNLVINNSASGTTGLYGLAGVVSGGNVLLYTTNYTIGDLDQTYLYGITDTLSFTTPTQASAETFTLLDTAPADSKFRGLAFAPTTSNGSVEVSSSPSGVAFTTSGTGCAPGTYTTPMTLAWTPGSICTLNVSAAQNGNPNAQYTFTQWDDGTNINTGTIYTVTAPATPLVYTASYSTAYLLTTAAGTGGSVSTGGFVDAGTNATVTATPSAGNYFVNFTVVNSTGSTTSTQNPLSLLMNGPQSVTANFAPLVSQTISFTQVAPATAAYNGMFPVAAQATSGLTVALSVNGGSASVCSLGTQNVSNNVTTATVTMISGTGTCTINANQSGGGSYGSASQQQTSATAAKAASSVQLSSSATGPVADDSSVVLTANVVSATAGTLTGNVTFLNGQTNLGTVASSAGVAKLTTSALPPGVNSITASYGGDTNFTGSTSVAETVSVNAPDFALSSSTSALTLAAGQSGAATITVTSLGYSGAVSLGCGTAPSYISCTFTPSNSINVSGTTVAQVQVNIQVGLSVSKINGNGSHVFAVFLPMGVLCFPMLGRNRNRRLRYLTFLVIACVAAGGMVGCVGGPAPPPAGTQTIMLITSGSGGISHQLPLQITITN